MSRFSTRAALAGVLLALGSGPLAGQAPAAAGPQRSAADGVFTEAQAQRGEMVFRQICAACHTAHREKMPDGTFMIK